MSIQERAAYGEAVALINRHGMVVVTKEHMQRLLSVIEAVERHTPISEETRDIWRALNAYSEAAKDCIT
jgi:hypothetical protein